MTGAAVEECRRTLESLLGAGDASSDRATDAVSALGAVPESTLDEAMRGFADAHGAAATPVLTRLGTAPAPRPVRRASKRALYRLAQRGVVTAPAPVPARPVIAREPDRATRAWLSGIDPTGARAVWILFEGGFGGRTLCSLVVSDTEGIVDAAGGAISKKRLDAELQALETERKLPWVEVDAAHAVNLVAEALQLHAERGQGPPEAFARWRPLFDAATPAPPPAQPVEVDAAALERSASLLEVPELAGWLLDPAAVQGDAVELLGARESRLVVSDQIKSEREDALLTRVIEREFADASRRRWSRRLAEMAAIFERLGRVEHAALATAASAGLADETRPVHHQPLVRALARRGLEVAGEIALGRLSASDVQRARARGAPAPPPAPAPPAAPPSRLIS